MARIDVFAASPLGAGTRSAGQSNYLVRTAASTLYYFFSYGGNDDFYYIKSTNGGLTWQTIVSVKASIAGVGLACWFDKWTPGDSGTVLHLAYMVAATIYYRALDTATDTLGGEITALAGTSFVMGANSCLSITKSKGGRIYIGYDGDGGTETGFLKSDDYPVTAFTAKTNVNEATSDYYWLFPGSYADTADIDCLYFDRSATELTLKTFDDSANTWSESAALSSGIANIASTTVCSNIAGVTRLSDGHLIVAAWTAVDLANADLLVWDVNGSGSITAKTEAVLNSTDDQGGVSLCIDTTGATETIYAYYLGKSDGSETWNTALNCYYKSSADGGATWGAETLLTDHVRTLTIIKAPQQTTNGELVVLVGSAVVDPPVVNLVSPAAAGGGGMRLAGHGGLAA